MSSYRGKVKGAECCPIGRKMQLCEHPIETELARGGTYHCRVAGVEWGLDALLFSFSSSVEGEKKERTSVKDLSALKTLFPSNVDALKAMIFWLSQHFRLIIL